MRHQILGSPIHTLFDDTGAHKLFKFIGLDTSARDIMDPRNYEQFKNLPPDIKKQLE